MSAVEITSTPGGILRISADSIAALDLLGVTLAASCATSARTHGTRTWRVEIHLDNEDLITATPATEPTPKEDAAP